jgi:hypothetical protein
VATGEARESGQRAPRMPNTVLRGIRENERHESQSEFAESMAQVAREMNLEVYPDGQYVQRLESGYVTWPHRTYRAILEALCGRSVRELGFAPSTHSAVNSGETPSRVNVRLREAIWQSGMELDRFARKIGVDPKTAERWVTRGVTPQPFRRWEISLILGIDESELWPSAVVQREVSPPRPNGIGGIDSTGEQRSAERIIKAAIPLHPNTLNLAPDPDLYDRITRVVERDARPDAQVIEWMERCLAEHRRVEDSIGAEPLIGIIRTQLSVVAGMAREARRPVSDAIVDLAAQYAQFMAWLCNDLQDKSAALIWYDRSHDWAIEAGDVNMAATTLSMKAHLAWSVGDAVRCVRLGEAARWNDDRTSLGVQGMASQMIARGHALDADTGKAHRALDEAETLIQSAAEHPEDEPDWMYFYGETWFSAQRGMIETELAERGAGNARYAVRLLDKALRDLPESYRRDRAWYGVMLARAHAAAKEYDAAAGTSLKFAGDAIAVNAYAASDLEDMSGTLARLGVREGRELADMLLESRS